MAFVVRHFLAAEKWFDGSENYPSELNFFAGKIIDLAKKDMLSGS